MKTIKFCFTHSRIRLSNGDYATMTLGESPVVFALIDLRIPVENVPCDFCKMKKEEK